MCITYPLNVVKQHLKHLFNTIHCNEARLEGSRASLVAQMVKNPSTKKKKKKSLYNMGDLGSVPGLGKSPEEWKVYSSILAWRSPWTNPVVLFFVYKLKSPSEV